MLGKGLQLNTTVLLVFFKKLLNNRIVDHLQKCDVFSDFQHGLRSSQSTADLLTVASDRIPGVRGPRNSIRCNCRGLGLLEL